MPNLPFSKLFCAPKRPLRTLCALVLVGTLFSNLACSALPPDGATTNTTTSASQALSMLKGMPSDQANAAISLALFTTCADLLDADNEQCWLLINAPGTPTSSTQTSTTINVTGLVQQATTTTTTPSGFASSVALQLSTYLGQNTPDFRTQATSTFLRTFPVTTAFFEQATNTTAASALGQFDNNLAQQPTHPQLVQALANFSTQLGNNCTLSQPHAVSPALEVGAVPLFTSEVWCNQTTMMNAPLTQTLTGSVYWTETMPTTTGTHPWIYGVGMTDKKEIIAIETSLAEQTPVYVQTQTTLQAWVGQQQQAYQTLLQDKTGPGQAVGQRIGRLVDMMLALALKLGCGILFAALSALLSIVALSSFLRLFGNGTPATVAAQGQTLRLTLGADTAKDLFVGVGSLLAAYFFLSRGPARCFGPQAAMLGPIMLLLALMMTSALTQEFARLPVGSLPYELDTYLNGILQSLRGR